MNSYKYALIDGNYVLSRNYFAIMRNYQNCRVPLGFAETLVMSVTTSILTMVSSFNIGKIIILWDTYPYHKSSLLRGSYKSTRYYMTEEDAEEIEDPEEREKAKIDAYNFERRTEAKNKLKLLGNISIPSLFRKGYEADDLAYMISTKLSENGESALLVSIDSDWSFWIQPGVDFYNPKSEVITTYEQSIIENKVDTTKRSLFRHKVLYDSFYGSHNDLVQSVTDEHWYDDVNSLMDRFEAEGYTTELFKDPSLARAQIESFNFSQYKDYIYIDSMYRSMDSIGSIASLSDIATFGTKIKVPFNVGAFEHYYNTLDKSLFGE